MKLPTRARYALRMLLFIAGHGGEEKPVSLAVIAGHTGLSRGYLEQVAAALRLARLVRAASGRRGGYRLARPASEITIGDVVEAMLGPVCIVDCLEDPASCMRADFCECRVVYSLINRRIAEAFHSCTLADLMDSDWIRSARTEVDRLASAPVRTDSLRRGDAMVPGGRVDA